MGGSDTRGSLQVASQRPTRLKRQQDALKKVNENTPVLSVVANASGMAGTFRTTPRDDPTSPPRVAGAVRRGFSQS